MIHADYVVFDYKRMQARCEGFFWEDENGLDSMPLDVKNTELAQRLDTLALHTETMDNLIDAFADTNHALVTAPHEEDECPFLMEDFISIDNEPIDWIL